jgi:polar amino acid transport system substrate-binding protein
MLTPTRTFLISLLALGLCGPSLADTLEVRSDNWMPYNGNPTAERPGYMVELLRAAFPKDTIHYAICPWAQACAELAEGKIDAILGALPNDAPGAVLPEQPSGATRNVFYVKKDTAWRFQGVESLASIRLGASAGYSYDNDGPLDTYLKQATAPAVQFGTGDTPLEFNLGKLRNGELDAIVEDANVVLWTLKQMQMPTGLIHSAGAYAKENSPLYVAFTQKKAASTARAAQFSAFITRYRESGELAKLLALYDLDDWQH